MSITSEDIYSQENVRRRNRERGNCIHIEENSHQQRQYIDKINLIQHYYSSHIQYLTFILKTLTLK